MASSRNETETGFRFLVLQLPRLGTARTKWENTWVWKRRGDGLGGVSPEEKGNSFRILERPNCLSCLAIEAVWFETGSGLSDRMLISHGWEFVEQGGIKAWAALCALRSEERVTVLSERGVEH